MSLQHVNPMPQFMLAAVENPTGFKPGLYYYVLFLPEGRKVSRYCRRASTAFYKLQRYVAKWDDGCRIWPEVGRVAELRDSRYVIPSPLERHLASVKLWWQGMSIPAYESPVRLP